MNSRCIALLALASCLGLVSGLSAQTGHPRFYLPDKPFDYETVLAPPGRLHDRLRRWNNKTFFHERVPDTVAACGTCAEAYVRRHGMRMRPRITNHGATLGAVA